jgi:hypothetical protein
MEETAILTGASRRTPHVSKAARNTTENSACILQTSIAKIVLVPSPSSLPAPTVPIPTISGANTCSKGTSQNFSIFNMASNLNIDKFKGSNTQNVDTWLSMYKHYCSFYDVSNKNSEDSFPFHLEDHPKILYDTIPDSQKANVDN